MSKIKNSEISESFLLLQTFAVVVTYDSKTTKNKLSQKPEGYFHCKTIFCHNLALNVSCPIMFHSHDI